MLKELRYKYIYNRSLLVYRGLDEIMDRDMDRVIDLR